MEVILLVIGALFGGLISWVITHKYYEKSSKEQKELLDGLSQEIKETNTLKYFEFLLENSKWNKEFIDHDEIWVAERNNTFQIKSGEEGREFHEEWTKMYPDQSTSRYPVYLIINNTIIKELTFISLDGGRIFVPMPDRKLENDKPSFFWNMNSLEIKVCLIIGHYYIYKDIFGVAKRSKIEIIN
jgi:hypothetical protein